jgi:hypothetical protein
VLCRDNAIQVLGRPPELIHMIAKHHLGRILGQNVLKQAGVEENEIKRLVILLLFLTCSTNEALQK